MSGNLEDNVRWICQKRGISAPLPVRMGGGDWMYEGKSYHSPAYDGHSVRNAAYVATRLIEKIREDESEYIEPKTLDKVIAIGVKLTEDEGTYGIEHVRDVEHIEPAVNLQYGHTNEIKSEFNVAYLVLAGIIAFVLLVIGVVKK